MDKKILPSHRGEIKFIEYSRIFLDEDRLVYATASEADTKIWNIPYINSPLIMLGNGCSITQAAMKKLAEEKTLLAITGTGGTPIFMGSLSEYSPTEHLVKYISIWQNPLTRLKIAQKFSIERCNYIDAMWRNDYIGLTQFCETDVFRQNIVKSYDVSSLRGFEGIFAKSLYVLMSRHVGIKWNGRIRENSKFDEPQDLVNKFLDAGNYLAYGLAGVVLYAMGIPPGLAVNHGETRAGGLVFDLADVIKDAVVMPRAMLSAKKRMKIMDFRKQLIDDLYKNDVLSFLFEIFVKSINEDYSS